MIYNSSQVRLGEIDVELPSRERIWHHVVRLHPVALMALVDDQDRVLLLWRHRLVQDRWGWELPGGPVDKDDEDPSDAAMREVEETTGFWPTRMRHI